MGKSALPMFTGRVRNSGGMFNECSNYGNDLRATVPDGHVDLEYYQGRTFS